MNVITINPGVRHNDDDDEVRQRQSERRYNDVACSIHYECNVKCESQLVFEHISHLPFGVRLSVWNSVVHNNEIRKFSSSSLPPLPPKMRKRERLTERNESRRISKNEKQIQPD